MRLDEQDDRVAQDTAGEQCHARGGRDAHPLDHAVADLGDQPEADEQRAEDAELDEQPGGEHLPRTAAREAPAAGDPLEQRSEQGEVEKRLHQSDDQPHLVAQRQAQRALEHQPRLVQETSSAGTSSGGDRLVAERATGQGQEDVVERRRVYLDAGQLDATPASARAAPKAAPARREAEVEQVALGAQHRGAVDGLGTARAPRSRAGSARLSARDRRTDSP